MYISALGFEVDSPVLGSFVSRSSNKSSSSKLPRHSIDMTNFVFRSVAILAVAGVAMLAKSQTTPACARTYVVQPGDFCNKISAQQNVSTFQLATVNSAIINADCSNLFVGETLCLGLVGQDCSTVHVVVSGDTCEAIAAGAGISFGDLLTDNPNVNAQCTNIGIDEVLCVAPVANSTAPA